MVISKTISIVSVLFLIFSFTTIFSAWATKYSLTDGRLFSQGFRGKILYLADLPHKINGTLKVLLNISPPVGKPDPYAKLIESKVGNYPDGHLLIPYVDSNWVSRIILLNVSNKISREIFRYNSKYQEAKYTDFLIGSEEYRQSAYSSMHRVTHPYLTKSGLLYYLLPWNDLVCFNLVSSKEEWRVRGAFHHSIETDGDGNLWVCGAGAPRGQNSNKNITQNFEDQLIVKISKHGKIVKAISVADLLVSSGFEYLLYGCSNPKLNVDPIHLNHIYPARVHSGLIRKGKLLVSLRNLSTVLMVDPETEKINWLQTGPWMNQHCVTPVGDSELSVLDNHAFGFGPDQYSLIESWKTKVLVHNIKSNTTKDVGIVLNGGSLFIPIEGLAIPVADGLWIIEDSIHGTIFLIENGAIRIKWSNQYRNGNVGYTSWCRFLTPDNIPDQFKIN